jgi:hypothetical protein
VNEWESGDLFESHSNAIVEEISEKEEIFLLLRSVVAP